MVAATLLRQAEEEERLASGHSNETWKKIHYERAAAIFECLTVLDGINFSCWAGRMNDCYIRSAECKC